MRLTRAALAVLLLAVLVGAAILGGAVVAGPTATPTPSPTTSPAPTAAALPAFDVPGTDLARLPRYPESVRVGYRVQRDDRFRLTAVEYLAAASVEEVRLYYQGVMDAQGWERADIRYSDGEWSYVLVDGSTEALIEIEPEHGLVEIDLQVSEPIEAAPSPSPTPRPTPEPTPASTPAPPPPPPAPTDDDDDDDGPGDGDDTDGFGGSDD